MDSRNSIESLEEVLFEHKNISYDAIQSKKLLDLILITHEYSPLNKEMRKKINSYFISSLIKNYKNEEVKLLINKIPDLLYEHNFDNKTPLEEAICYQNYAVVKLFLDDNINLPFFQNADTQITSTINRLFSLLNGNILGVIDFYIFLINEYNAKLNLSEKNINDKNVVEAIIINVNPDNYKSTVLPEYRDKVCLLVKLALDMKVNLGDFNVEKMLMLSIYYDNPDLFKLLIQRHPELSNTTIGNLSILQYAIACNADDVKVYLFNSSTINFLDDPIMNLNIKNKTSAVDIIKKAIFYENEGKYKTKINTIIDSLYENKLFQPALNIIAAELCHPIRKNYKPLRIFVADGVSISSFRIEYGGGLIAGDFDRENNILRLAGERSNEELAGDIVHEMHHAAAQLTYQNDTLPYFKPSNDTKHITQLNYEKAIDEMIIFVEKHRIMITSRDIEIKSRLVDRMADYMIMDTEAQRKHGDKYVEGMFTKPEWIVGIPESLVRWGDWIVDNSGISYPEFLAKSMFDYWRERFIPDTEQAFISHPSANLVIIAQSSNTTSNAMAKNHNLLLFDKNQIISIIANFNQTNFKKIFNINKSGNLFIVLHHFIMKSIFDLIKINLPEKLFLPDVYNLINQQFLLSEKFITAYNNLAKTLISYCQSNKITSAAQINQEKLSHNESIILAIKNCTADIAPIVTHITQWDKDNLSDYHNVAKEIISTIGNDLSSEQKIKLKNELVSCLYQHIRGIENEVKFSELAQSLVDAIKKNQVMKTVNLFFYSQTTYNVEKLFACIEQSVKSMRSTYKSSFTM